MNRLTSLALAVGSFVALATGSAGAQQAAPEPLPRSGEFSLIFTFVNPEPWSAVPRAVDAAGAVTETATVATNIAWLMNAEGSGFAHQMTGQCSSFTRLVGTTNVENYGNCVYTDAQGDKLFEEFNRLPGETVTNGRWIGGTGKYAGISASFTIQGIPGFAGRVEGGPLGAANEVFGVSAGTKTGSYTLPPL
ncbi:MAG: hypothetical protein AB7O56_01385 [Bauldia sp.]